MIRPQSGGPDWDRGVWACVPLGSVHSHLNRAIRSGPVVPERSVLGYNIPDFSSEASSRRCGRHFCRPSVRADWCGAASTNDPVLAVGLDWMRHKEIEFSVEPAVGARRRLGLAVHDRRRRGSNRKDRGEAEAFGNPTGPIDYRPGAKETESAFATWQRHQQRQGIAPPGRSRAEAAERFDRLLAQD